jgi:hypothetical protein
MIAVIGVLRRGAQPELAALAGTPGPDGHAPHRDRDVPAEREPARARRLGGELAGRQRRGTPTSNSATSRRGVLVICGNSRARFG